MKNHAWFHQPDSSLDWDWLMKVQGSDHSKDSKKPPYVPQVSGAGDGKNFSASEADLPPTVPYKDDGSGWDKTF